MIAINDVCACSFGFCIFKWPENEHAVVEIVAAY